MGIAKGQFNSILTDIFTAGNVIKLYSTMPDEETESGGVTIANSQAVYEIQDGDFSVSGGIVTSVKNMLLYLCETAGGDGSAAGFGVFSSGGELLYFGSFTEPMSIGYNTVPTIKRYSAEKGEGVRVTMVSKEITEASASSE